MPRWTSTQYFLVSGKLFSFLTQSLVFPYDILIEDDGKDGPVTFVTDEQPKKHWKTKKQYPWSKKSFLTVNDVKDASNNSPGANIFVCPPDENCSGEDSADNQLHNLHLLLLLLLLLSSSSLSLFDYIPKSVL